MESSLNDVQPVIAGPPLTTPQPTREMAMAMAPPTTKMATKTATKIMIHSKPHFFCLRNQLLLAYNTSTVRKV